MATRAMYSFRVFDPRVEVRGRWFNTFIDIVGVDELAAFLERRGLDWIDNDVWYKQQVWLDIFSEIANALQDTLAFVDYGRRFAAMMPLSSDLHRMHFSRVVNAFNGAYQLHHRGGDAGIFRTEIVDNKHLSVAARVPYPDDFVYGILYQLAERFLPPETPFDVFYPEHTHQRDQQGVITHLHIMWG